MNIKVILLVLLILIFRVSDIISTHFALLNQKGLENEANLLVKFFNINSFTIFYAMEMVFAILMVLLYLYSEKRNVIFKIKAINFKEYLNFIFYKKRKISLFEFVFKTSIKNSIIVIGQITPYVVIATSTLYIINNMFVYLANSDRHYNRIYFKINDIVPFKLLIYTIPVIVLLIILFTFLFKKYKMNQISN